MRLLRPMLGSSFSGFRDKSHGKVRLQKEEVSRSGHHRDLAIWNAREFARAVVARADGPFATESFEGLWPDLLDA